MDYGYQQRNAILPPIGYSDMNIIKREESEYQRKHSTIHMQTGVVVNPPSPYPGLPPTYTFPPPVSSSAPSLKLLKSPVQARRSLGNGKESYPVEPQLRQSLPSIYEALGTSEPLMYPTQQVVSAPILQPYHPALAPPSPSSTKNVHHDFPRQNSDGQRPRTVAYTPQIMQPSHGTSTVQPAYAHPGTTSKSASTVHKPRPPALQPIITSQSPRPSLRETLSQPWQTSASAQNNHVSQQTIPYPSHTYPQHQSQSAHMPPPPSKHAANPAPPPTLHPTVPSPIITWRNLGLETGPAESTKKSGQSYAESVIRHLDVFDLESSLNQISDSSRQLLEFSSHYRQRAHETQRSGPLPGTMPHLNEIDDKMQHANEIQDSLGRIRDVLHAQQVALAERSKEQLQKVAHGYISEDGESQQDDGKGSGFTGNDPKKPRRARAAPPGRCHSCNRAETPEWRRGPDGARTLCNACGLHYAKLTRKMGASKNAIGSSNLRPKSLGPGSPTL